MDLRSGRPRWPKPFVSFSGEAARKRMLVSAGLVGRADPRCSDGQTAYRPDLLSAKSGRHEEGGILAGVGCLLRGSILRLRRESLKGTVSDVFGE